MKHKISIGKVLIALIHVSAIYMLSAQNKIVPEHASAAQHALETFKKLVNEKNYKSHGLKSAKEAATTHLGEPIEVHTINLNDLREYKTGQAKAILNPGSRVIYPLETSDSSIASAAELDYVGGKWETRSFGKTHDVTAYKSYLAKIKTDPNQKTFLVSIPALALKFIGTEKAGQTYLTYIGDKPFDSITPGLTLPLEEVVNRIQPKAKAYNGLPR